MAHSDEGRRLTEQHRQAQVSLTAKLTTWLRRLFVQMVEPGDLAASSSRFVEKALPVILETREMSREMAKGYLEEFRRAELEALVYKLEDMGGPVDSPALPDGTRLDMTPDEMRAALNAFPSRNVRNAESELDDLSRLRSDLHSAAIGVHRRQERRGDSPTQARDRAATATALKAARHVSEASREPLLDEVEEGRRRGAIGYARVVDADPCAFCAMLASRGPVYRSDAFDDVGPTFAGGNRFATHDGCECSLEPVYGRRGSDLPPGSAELAQQWVEVTAGRPDKWAAWRRWRESGTRPGEERVDAAERADSGTSSTPKGRREAARRQQRREENLSKWGSERKPLDRMNSEELSNAIKGLTYRRHAMRDELARFEAGGHLPDEPGRPAVLAAEIEKITAQLEEARERLPLRLEAEAAKKAAMAAARR